MDIDEARKKKRDCEFKILEMLQDFERSTGCSIQNISVSNTTHFGVSVTNIVFISIDARL